MYLSDCKRVLRYI